MKMRHAILEGSLVSFLIALTCACSSKQVASLGDDRMISNGGSSTGGQGQSGSQSQSGAGTPNSGAAAGSPSEQEPGDDLPETFGTKCVERALPGMPEPDVGNLAPWLELPGFGPILRATATDDSVWLLAPSAVARVDVGTNSYCVATDLPKGWTSRDLRALPDGALLLSIAPPDRPATLYLSQDRGTTWTLTSSLADGSGERGPSRISLDPAGSAIYASDLGDLVLKSVDSGSTWTNVVDASKNASFSGSIAVDRSGTLLMLAQNGGTGGCGLRALPLSETAPEWRNGILELMLPCSGLVSDPGEDRTFYVFGSNKVTRVVVDADGTATEDATLSDGNMVINDLWADRAGAGHVRFTGVVGSKLAVYDTSSLSSASPLPTDAGEGLIGGAALPVPGGGFSIWAFAPSSDASQAQGFVLGTP